MSYLSPRTQAELKAIYFAFASFGSAQKKMDMDGKSFAKLCKDNKITGKNFTLIDVDIIFAKVKAKGQRKISFDEFLKALDEIAAKKGEVLEDIATQVIACGGPVDSGTKPLPVKWHDDKSTYTGVYARGGPTNIDMDPTNLGALCDRSSADVRGIKMRHPGRRATGHEGVLAATSAGVQAPGAPTARRATSEQLSAVRRSTTDYLAGKMANMGV